MAAKERPGAVASARRAEKLIRKPHYEFDVNNNSPSPRDFQRLSDATRRVIAPLRRERLAEHLHRLGERPCLEAMIEVAAGADLDAVLTRYSRLNPEIVRAFRGERFPPLPIHEVWR